MGGITYVQCRTVTGSGFVHGKLVIDPVQKSLATGAGHEHYNNQNDFSYLLHWTQKYDQHTKTGMKDSFTRTLSSLPGPRPSST